MTPCEFFILSGGAGTRLWPLSRETYPKQFYDLAGTGNPLLIDTVKRLAGMGNVSVVTTEKLRFSTLGLLIRSGHSNVTVVGEPQARNTAAAVALVTWISLQKNPDTLVGVFPADHFIQQSDRFRELVQLAFREARSKNEVITLGVSPDHPATGFGYLELAERVDETAVPNHAMAVRRFVEKPSVAKAEELLATHRAVWNAGMFIFPAQKMAEHFRRHMPTLWNKIEGVRADLANLAEIYPELESQSVDYGIMEKLDRLSCVPGTGMGWSDVGSWEEVAKKGKCLGDPVEIEGNGNFYTGFGHHPKRVAFVGVDDLAVIDTPDALMIVKKGHGQEVRDVVANLKVHPGGAELLKSHVFEERPWGRFEVLMNTENFKSKRIIVWPGQKISYQSHKHRNEHWVMVKGQASVTLDDVIHPLKGGEHIYIPAGAKHRISNATAEALEFIEVQTGTYFGEDDIVRYSDDYGRT